MILRNHRRILQSCTAIAAALAFGHPVTAYAQQQTYAFDLPAQPLGSALRAFAKVSRQQVTFSDAAVSGKTAPILSGAYTADAALSQLLSGSGLTMERGQSGLLIIRDASAASAGESQAGSAAAVYESADIVVTARKTSERIQDVPIAITAISGAQIEERAAVDIKDVLGSVPGLSYGGDQDRGQGNYSIRGVTSTTASPTTGIYLDDIPVITATSKGVFAGAYDVVFFDIERLEVLKGPQGTLYGGNAMGGAIKYVSARPNLSAISGSAAVNVATTAHGGMTYGAEGILNLPIVQDVLAVRGGLYYKREGGYIDNIANGEVETYNISSTPSTTFTPTRRSSLSTVNAKNINHVETLVGRFSVLWQPSADFTIRPALFYQKFKINNASTFFPNLGEMTSTWRRVPQPLEDEAAIYSLEIIKDFGDAELTSLTSYFDRTVKYKEDFSFFIGTLVPDLFGNTSFADYPSQNKTFSQELRLSSPSDSRLRWTVGAFYSNQRVSFDPFVTTVGSGAYFGTGSDFVFGTNQVTKLEQIAAFGEATYRILDGLEATVGLRAFKFREDNTETHEGVFAGGPGGSQDHSSSNGVNPKFGLSYKVNNDHLLYASAAKGFRPGGAIGNKAVIDGTPSCTAQLQRLGFSSAPSSYGADNLWSYEAGSKNSFADGRLIANAAVFYTDWKDIQQAVNLPCGHGFTINAGAARIRGVELESRFDVTSAFQIGGTLTYNDAEISKVVFGGATKVGDDILATPKWMFSAYGSYSVPFSATWNLQGRIDYQYRDGQRNNYVDTLGVVFSDGVSGTIANPAEFQDGYDVLNATLSIESDRTTVRLFASNILDNRPTLHMLIGNYPTNAQTLRPRTIGLEVRQKF